MGTKQETSQTPSPSQAAIGRVGHDEKPLWQILVDLAAEVPEEALASLPRDGAAHVDDYIG